jgi:hypothetical protein
MPPTTPTDNRLGQIRVSGTGLAGHLTNIAERVQFSAAIDLVPALNFTFADDAELTLFRSRLFDQGATISYGDWGMTIADVDLEPAKHGPVLKVEARSTFVSRWEEQQGAKTWNNVDMTQWFMDQCREVGATPVVQPGLGRGTLVRETTNENGRHSTWDVVAQAKRELGLWLFERGQKIIIGRPSWIVQQTQHIAEWPLVWNTWYDYSPTIDGMPIYHGRNRRLSEQTLRFKLTASNAEDIRLGDRVPMAGAFPGLWIVTNVVYPMTSNAPVDVTCSRPVDPGSEADTRPGGLGSVHERTAGGTYSGSSGAAPQISLSNLPARVAGYGGQQLINAAHIIRANQAAGHPKRAAQIGVMTAMAETALTVQNYGTTAEPDRRGLFRQPPEAGTYPERMDAFLSSAVFLRALTQVADWSTRPPGEAASAATQHLPANTYTEFWAAAVAVVDAILATATPSGGVALGGNVPPGLSSAVDRYVNATRGQVIRTDAGARSTDLTADYTRALGGPPIPGTGRDWWSTGRTSGFFTGISTDSAARKGDVACWSARTPGGPGHAAIVLQDQGSTLRVLSQNPGAAQIINISKNGLQGYLRPKQWR